MKFGRERTFADAGAVGLGDAEDVVEHVRTDAGAGAGRAGDGVGARDVRVRTVVDVEHRALGAFEEELLAFGALLMEFGGDVADHRTEALGVGEHVVDDFVGVKRLGTKVVFENEVVILQDGADLLDEAFLVEEVGDAQRAAGNLVLVGGADATARRADLLVAGSGFAGMVKGDVVRHDEGGVGGDAQTLLNVGHADGVEFVDFAEEGFRREDDAVAEVADGRGMHNAGRNETENGLLAVDHERVTGIVTAVEADDAGDLFGQPVNDLALAFVAPLSADHNYILGHEITLNEQIDGGSEPPIGCPQKQGSSCGLEMD